MVHHVMWQGARNELWLAIRRGGEKRSKMMKGRSAVVKGKEATVIVLNCLESNPMNSEDQLRPERESS